MVVADTIRKEQDISAKTAPLIESTVNSVLNTAQTVSSLSFYRTLFEKGINMPFSTAASSSEAEKFHNAPFSQGFRFMWTSQMKIPGFLQESTQKIFLLRSPMQKAHTGTVFFRGPTSPAFSALLFILENRNNILTETRHISAQTISAITTAA